MKVKRGSSGRGSDFPLAAGREEGGEAARDGPGPRWAGPCGTSLCPFASGRSARSRPLGPSRACHVTEGPPGPLCRGAPAPSSDSAAGQGLVPSLEGSPPGSTHGPRFDPRRRLKDWLVGLRPGRSGARAGALALGLGGVAVGRRMPPGRCAGGTAGAGGGPDPVRGSLPRGACCCAGVGAEGCGDRGSPSSAGSEGCSVSEKALLNLRVGVNTKFQLPPPPFCCSPLVYQL